MVIYEMREASREKAFDLIDELHELGHHKKMVLCELEDTLYDCFDTSKDEEEHDTDEGTDLGFKAHRYSMRNFDDDDMDTKTMYRRRKMGMRRNRMGRYV
jgi:hypothetical protein